MAATRIVLSFLCIALASAAVFEQNVRSSAQVDATGDVRLMPDGADAAQFSKHEVIRVTEPQLKEVATFAQIKPVQDLEELAQIKASLTDRFLEYMQGTKTEQNAEEIFTAMKPHFEPLKQYAETHGPFKASDVIDTERVAGFVQKLGANDVHMKELRMLFGIQKLYEDNGMSLEATSAAPSFLDPKEKAQFDFVNDLFQRIGIAVMGGDLDLVLQKISVVSTVCPICAPAVVYMGMATWVKNMVEAYPKGSLPTV